MVCLAQGVGVRVATTTMNQRSIVLVIVSLVLGAAGGYWLGSRAPDMRLPMAQDAAPGVTRTPKAPIEKVSLREDSVAPGVPLSPAEDLQLREDPASLIEGALALADADQRRNQLLRLGDAWAHLAPEDAWQEALRVADPEARRIMQSAVIPAWAEQQPERAFAGVAELPPNWDRTQLLQHVTAEIARHDPQLALNLISSVKLPDPDSYRGIIVGEWSRYDPAGAAQWVERQPVRLQGRFAYRVADAYVGQHPQEALDWALRISRSPGKNLWSNMLRQMALHEPQEALRIALAAENPMQRSNALSGVLSSIATTNPTLAMSHLEKIPGGEMRTQVIMEIAARLSETSVASAVDWLNDLDDTGMRRQAWAQVSQAIVYRDPDGAAELLDRIPKEARESWIGSVAAAYAQSDPNKAIQWIRKFQDEPNYPRIAQQVVMNAAGSNPELAMDIINRTTDGKQREQLLAAVMPMIAHMAPETAARLYEDISDENLRVQTVGQIASGWARSDQAAARKWVTSLPSGTSRDQALAGLIGASEMTADDAASLIRQIQSPEQRQNALFSTAIRLAQSNPEEMRSLLRRFPLDPPQQQHLESILKQQGIDGW